VLIAVGWLLFLRPLPLLPEATAALSSTDAVTYRDDGDWLSFEPTGVDGPTKDVGLIIYPGARVGAAGYAPTAQALASRGYPTFVVEMPLDLAILGVDRADAVREANPEVERWVIAGHSLGGAMAGAHVASHPGTYGGLGLWAAWPASDTNGAVADAASIYGTLDGAAARIVSDESRGLLPPAAGFVPIDGGNHEQMAWYTGQPGDPPAEISREEQQRQLVDATITFLEGQTVR
jgi:hypothetical protein